MAQGHLPPDHGDAADGFEVAPEPPALRGGPAVERRGGATRLDLETTNTPPIVSKRFLDLVPAKHSAGSGLGSCWLHNRQLRDGLLFAEVLVELVTNDPTGLSYQ